MWDHAILFLCDVNWFRTRTDDGCRVLIDDCKKFNAFFHCTWRRRDEKNERSFFSPRFYFEIWFFRKRLAEDRPARSTERFQPSRISPTEERERRKMHVSRPEIVLTMHTTHFGGSSSVTFDEEYKRSVCWFVGENLDGDQTDAQRFSWHLYVPWFTVHGFLTSIFAGREKKSLSLRMTERLAVHCTSDQQCCCFHCESVVDFDDPHGRCHHPCQRHWHLDRLLSERRKSLDQN